MWKEYGLAGGLSVAKSDCAASVSYFSLQVIFQTGRSKKSTSGSLVEGCSAFSTGGMLLTEILFILTRFPYIRILIARL